MARRPDESPPRTLKRPSALPKRQPAAEEPHVAAPELRIAGAAAIWLAANPDEANRDMRFDAMLVAPGRFPVHIAAAFETT